MGGDSIKVTISCTPEEIAVIWCCAINIVLQPLIAMAVSKAMAKRTTRAAFQPTFPDLLRKRKLTRLGVARRLNVPFKVVRGWCKGISYPDIHQAAALASLLGVGEKEIFLAISRSLRRPFAPNRNRR